MDRVNYRRLHDELCAEQSNAFKHYLEQATKVGTNLYKCFMSICYGDQSFEAYGYGTVYVTAREEASSSLIDKMRAQNLLNKSLVNLQQQQFEQEKQKVYDLNRRLTEAQEKISNLEQKITELEKSEKIMLDDVLTAISGSNLPIDGWLIQENGQTRRDKIIKELKKLFKSIRDEKLQLQQICSEKEKIFVTKENESRQLKADLVKANEIIKKLHDQLKSASYKVSILGEVATKQDEVVETKDLKIKRLEGDLKICVEKLRERESEIDDLKEEFKSLRSKYDSSKDQIRTDKNVITWLNKQLADLRAKVDETKTDDIVNRRKTFGGTNLNKEATSTKGKIIIPELPKINLTCKIDSENLNNHKPSSSRYKPI